MEIDKLIERFISKHHVMTIATLGDGDRVRTANLFYAYCAGKGEFIFASSVETAHGMDMLRYSTVGANIVKESSNIGILEGLQIEGQAFRPLGDELSSARARYVKRFPFAVVADLEIWILRADFFKLTDNKLGFGKKIIWKRAQ